MKAYVINVPETVDAKLSHIRRSHMEAELARASLDYQWVDAVDGTRLTLEDRAQVVDESMVSEFPNWLLPGVIGASLSHLQAYRQIIDDGEQVGLVLEDDVILPGNLTALQDAVSRSLKGREVALLYWNTWPGCQLSLRETIDLEGGVRLMRPVDARLVKSAAAYVITREACEGMIKARLPIRAGTDNWLDFVTADGFDRLWVVVPRPVAVRSDFKSTVEYLRPGSLSARVSGSVARRRIFPLYHAFAWRRRRLERRASEFTLVDRPALPAANGG